MRGYQQLKIMITNLLPIAHDALHVLVGLGIVLVVCGVLRKPLHWKGAFGIALLAACFAEFMDYRADMRVYGHWLWHESVKDILLTISPAVLLALYSKLKR